MIAVLFEADALPEAQERYFQLASELKPLLSHTPRFISIERYQSLTTPGKILSLSWWEDEASVAGWKQNVMHQPHLGHNTVRLRLNISPLHILPESFRREI